LLEIKIKTFLYKPFKKRPNGVQGKTGVLWILINDNICIPCSAVRKVSALSFT
jgi:hypothetical protein